MDSVDELCGITYVRKEFKFDNSPYYMYILLHGGGSCPQDVNDEQFHQMQSRYDASFNTLQQNAVAIVPRAFTNTWDLHFQPESFQFYNQVIKLIRQQFCVERVYLLGYSAGADACWNIGMCKSDMFDGIIACCGHPNNVYAGNLVNFIQQAGDQDCCYGRNEQAELYSRKLESSYIRQNCGHQIHDNRFEVAQLTNSRCLCCNSILLLNRLVKQRQQKHLVLSFADHQNFRDNQRIFFFQYIFVFNRASVHAELRMEDSFLQASFNCDYDNLTYFAVIDLNMAPKLDFTIGFTDQELKGQCTKSSNTELSEQSAEERADNKYKGFGLFQIKKEQQPGDT